MTRRSFLLIIAALTASLGLPASAREPVPIVNHSNLTWARPDGKQLDLATVRNQIIQAANSKSWTVENAAGENTLLAQLVVRNKHTIRTTITYTPSTFSVKYHSSENMKYGIDEPSVEVDPLNVGKKQTRREVIHPHYNRWTQELVSAIQAQLSR